MLEADLDEEHVAGLLGHVAIRGLLSSMPHDPKSASRRSASAATEFLTSGQENFGHIVAIGAKVSTLATLGVLVYDSPGLIGKSKIRKPGLERGANARQVGNGKLGDEGHW